MHHPRAAAAAGVWWARFGQCLDTTRPPCDRFIIAVRIFSGVTADGAGSGNELRPAHGRRHYGTTAAACARRRRALRPANSERTAALLRNSDARLDPAATASCSGGLAKTEVIRV